MRLLLAFHSMVTRSNHRLAEELAAQPNVELTVVAPTWWHEESRDIDQEVTCGRDYRLIVLPTLHGRRLHPNLFVYRRGLGRALRETTPDIIDLYEEPCSLVSAQVLALRTTWSRHSQLVFYSAQNIFKRYPPPFAQVEQWTFGVASHAHVCNSEAGDVLRRKGYMGDLRLIPLGVDHERFIPAPDRLAAKEALGLRGTVIGYLGRLHSEKGIFDVLEAFAALRLPDTVLFVVGSGPHQSLLQKQARDHGVAQRVVFAGAIQRTRLRPYLHAMDCLVVPSRTTPTWKEQFGRVIVEAFLSGVPVIGSSSGAIPELIGDDGFVYPEGSIAELANTIRAVVQDVALRQERAQRARARALRSYTWQAVATQRYHLYRDMLGVRDHAVTRRSPILVTRRGSQSSHV